jgi:hypothetical protein
MVGQEAARKTRMIPPDRFHHFAAIDWSGAMGERQKGIAVAICGRDGAAPHLLRQPGAWSREDVYCYLRDQLPDDTLVGMDLSTSMPFADCTAYFPAWDRSPRDAHELWALVEEISARDPHLTAGSFVDHPEASRYFRRHGAREGDRFHHAEAGHRRGRFRVTEHAQAAMGCKPYSNFNLVGAAQVGKASLAGMRMLHRLKGHLPVWPIDPLPPRGSVIVEIYTALAAIAGGRPPSRSKMRNREELNLALAQFGCPPVAGSGPLDDHSSDALLASAWLRMVADRPGLWAPQGMTDEIARTEGWTFGAV